jgi:hypothetical protein
MVECVSQQSGGLLMDIDKDDLVTIKHFVNPLQASLARSQLESEGIFVHLWGEHLGIANIVFSAATGGMRLQVRSDQADRAREILAAVERGDYSLDENSKFDDE